MPKERTEEEMLAGEPLKLRFGAKDYDVPILGIGKARAWRAKVIQTAQSIVGLGVSSPFGLGAAFSTFPDKICDLVFEYASALNKDEVLETATEEQVALAFSSLVSVSFPFLRQLSLMKAVTPPPTIQ